MFCRSSCSELEREREDVSASLLTTGHVALKAVYFASAKADITLGCGEFRLASLDLYKHFVRNIRPKVWFRKYAARMLTAFNPQL
jgi:hypothetical protein